MIRQTLIEQAKRYRAAGMPLLLFTINIPDAILRQKGKTHVDRLGQACVIACPRDDGIGASTAVDLALKKLISWAIARIDNHSHEWDVDRALSPNAIERWKADDYHGCLATMEADGVKFIVEGHLLPFSDDDEP